MLTAVGKEAERVKVGQELTVLESRTSDLLGQIQKTLDRAKELKQKMVDEDHFTQTDVDELQAAIDAKIIEAETMFTAIKNS